MRVSGKAFISRQHDNRIIMFSLDLIIRFWRWFSIC